MSQAALKPSRPLSLSQTSGKRSSSSRPNTPQTATNKSETSDDITIVVLDDSPVAKRRPSRDSPKVKSPPKLVEQKQETNGKHENGTNGSHIESELKAPETPKSSKKQKEKLAEKEDEEMEPLVVELDQQAETPKKSIGKSAEKKRILTPRQGPPANRIKVNQTDGTENASTIVNLSTVSEQSSEAVPSPLIDESPIVPPSRATGRRSIRPIKDIQLSYRSTKLNDSSSSLNVTVGSQIHNDSLSSPGWFSRKRKEGLEHEGFVDSPSKRARIDFSGFLGYVATPVTLLKSRLSRVGLSSTPRKLDTDESKIADVSGTEVTTGEEDLESKMEIVDDGLKDEKETNENSDIEIKEKSIDRSFCNIM